MIIIHIEMKKKLFPGTKKLSHCGLVMLYGIIDKSMSSLIQEMAGLLVDTKALQYALNVSQ